MVTSDDRKVESRPFPWWISVIAATLTYLGLKYYLPQIETSNEFIRTLSEIGPTIAPILTIGFLLLGAKQLYDKNLPESDNEAPHPCEDDADGENNVDMK